MDEILIRWYILGGDCINIGLPNYMHMDHNTHSGWKINDIWFWIIMVMLKLDLENGKTVDRKEAAANWTSSFGDDNNGTKSLKYLVEPIAVKGERVVKANSYFSSVK